MTIEEWGEGWGEGETEKDKKTETKTDRERERERLIHFRTYWPSSLNKEVPISVRKPVSKYNIESDWS